MSEDTLATVEPTVRAPVECVQRLVRVLVSPAVQEDLGFPIGDKIGVRIGHEHEVGRRTNPNTTKPHLETADEIEVVQEHRSLIKGAVVVRVFEDQYVILALAFRTALGVRVRLGNPNPSARIKRHRNGLVQVGFTSDEIGMESVE